MNLVAAGLSSAIILMAGCSSSGKPAATSSSTAAGGGSSASSTATGTPINVGSITTASGPQQRIEASDAIQAWAKSVNAAGGINGHPVNLTVEDDQGNAATALQAAKTLVESDHVVAIIGDTGNQDLAWASYVTSAGIPVVGGEPTNTPFMTNADFFPVGANDIATNYGMLAIAKQYGTKVGALYCAESPVCAGLGPVLKLLGAPQGISVPVVQSISASATDYTAQCQALIQAGVGSYTAASTNAVPPRVVQQCKQQGLKAPELFIDGELSANWLTNSAMDGATGAEPDAPFTDTSTSAGRDFQAAIKKYYPSIVGSTDGPFAMYAWLAGKLFEAAAKAAPSGTLTSASVKQGLYSLKGETLGGLAPPLTFTQGQPTLINCYFQEQIKGGQLTEPNGLQTQCAPDATISSALKTLGLSK